MRIERRRSTSGGAVALVLSMGLSGCGGGGRPPVGPPDPSASPTVEIARVVERPVDVTLSMPGQLDPYQSCAVFAKVTGFVKSVRVDRGSRVRTGDPMAELEAPELLAQRAEAESRLHGAEAQLAVSRSKAEADASTYEKLKAASATPGVVAGNDLVLAQKAMEANEGQVAAARQTVEAARQAARSIAQIDEYLHVRAPFDGVVTERNVHPGSLVGPGSGTSSGPMLRLVQDDRLRLVIPIPEAYAAHVDQGLAVSFAVPAYPGRAFSGTIARVAHAIDQKTRTMAVELEVANRDRSLTPGTFCQVQWPVHRSGPSLFVPAGSVASTTDRTFVVRIRDGKTEWVDVRTGLTAGPLTEVFGELREGDFVAARGTDELRPGTLVRAKEKARSGRS